MWSYRHNQKRPTSMCRYSKISKIAIWKRISINIELQRMAGITIIDNWVIDRFGLWSSQRFVKQDDGESVKIENVVVCQEIKKMQWFELVVESAQPLWCIYALCWVIQLLKCMNKMICMNVVLWYNNTLLFEPVSPGTTAYIHGFLKLIDSLTSIANMATVC